MVNEASPTDASGSERRERPRRDAAHVATLGAQNLNPFGDLHTLQHLSARLARGLRPVFEQLQRQQVRCWAEPLVVQRFADYLGERAPGLTAWVPLAIEAQGQASDCQALLVADGKFVLELLDTYFGGTGAAPPTLPTEFTPAAEAMAARLGTLVAEPLRAAWEPVARLSFRPGHPESSSAMLGDLDGDDAVIITRFGIAAGTAKPVWLDLVYPVAALKPHGSSLTAKVHGKSAAAPAPSWRTGLTRACMGVRLPVRSVLAEPVVPLAQLLELKAGDVIPISFGAQVPVMVCARRLGAGTVGTSNGRAAIKLSTIERLDEEDFA